MTSVFEDIILQARLFKELEEWRGTPFVGHMAKKGLGCDCIRFAAAVLESLELFRVEQWPRYGLGGGGEALRDMLCAEIEKAACFVQVEEPFLSGDLLVFESRAFLHTGLVGDGPDLWHCLRRSGVTKNRLDDETFRKRLFRIYRLMED